MSFGSWFKHTFSGDDATHDANGNPTDADPSGGIGDGQHGHQGAARGSVRTGTGPDINNYSLGGDPAFYGQQEQRVQDYGGQAVDAANYFNKNAQNISGQAQNFGGAAGSRGLSQNKSFQGQANAAQGRAAPTTRYGSEFTTAQSMNGYAGDQQLGLAERLAALGNAPEGPSAAQAQLQQGTNQAIASQLAIARSGRGLGESATGLSQAGQQASAAIANEANASAALRAQETQAYRQNQLNAFGASGQVLDSSRSGNLGLAQQAAQVSQFGTQSQLQEQQLNDAYANELSQLGLAAQGQGYQAQEQGLAQQLAAQQTGEQAEQQGQAIRAGYQSLGLGAAQGQQQGLENYENELSNIYGMDIGAQVQNRQLNQQNSTNWVNGVMGGISSLAALASDRRAKRNVRDENLDAVFRALDDGDAHHRPAPPQRRARATQLSERYSALAD